jgi:hypothetical protein
MVKTIYIHIGSHKTGTSAIQKFLSTNREVLQQKGFCYPGNKVAHHDMAREFRTLELPVIAGKPDLATRKYFDEISTSRSDTIILSSEGFEGLYNSVHKLKDFLKDQFCVKIIFYARSQGERIESMYNQRVKQEVTLLEKPFSDFVGNGYFAFLDYYKILLPWGQAFGKENIIVRCYEKEQLPDGIFDDFIRAVGLPPDKNYVFPKEKVNQSLKWDLIEIIRICNTRFKGDIHFHRFLVNSLEEINRGYTEEQQRLLSPVQRRGIIELYEESNAKVAREYLGRLDGRLFYAPLPDLNEPWTPYRGLTVEKIVPIFTQMMFNLERKHQKQRNAIENRSLKRRIFNRLKKTGKYLGLLR